MRPKYFSRGSGRLTSDILNEVTTQSYVEVYQPPQTVSWNGIPTNVIGPQWEGPQLCSIKGSTGMSDITGATAPYGGRYQYDLEQFAFANMFVSAGLSGDQIVYKTNGFKAINLSEMGNTGANGADDRIRLGLTAGQIESFEIEPIQDDAAVFVYKGIVTGGESGGVTGDNIIYIFDRTNQFAGPC